MLSHLTTPCRRDHYPARLCEGVRDSGAVRLIALHSTESPCEPGAAAAVAGYFQSDEAGGSAHRVVDDDGCERCLGDLQIAEAAPGANTQGFHIEQCGYAAWSHNEWVSHLPMLHRVAYHVATAAGRFDVPLRFVGHRDLAAGRSGVTTHAAITKWQNSIGQPGTHTDPGEHYPLSLVISLARHYHTHREE